MPTGSRLLVPVYTLPALPYSLLPYLGSEAVTWVSVSFPRRPAEKEAAPKGLRGWRLLESSPSDIAAGLDVPAGSPISWVTLLLRCTGGRL